ncbi:unnamed protein product [Adineta steineri]|uniref:NAD(P)(+)--arginine ADP-ribosyltransferase n=1 Tax=Adineta steineri TaxID=433720 RepID=A0A815D769_9BILA|nr:unnamed protein product [Adineta steineri]
MNRFSDIDCSFKRLAPVYGFRVAKLVSIEEALQSVESQIDELPYFINVAKRHCHYPSEHGLTHDESASIYIYTMEWGEQTLYRVLNKTLRNENRHLCKIWFPYLKLFDTALNKLPTVKEVVWRGITADIGKNFTKNQRITWWSINSCSSSVNVIKGFLGNEKNSTTLLIEALNGKKVSGYTKYESEDEIILRVGTEFRVKSDALEHPKGSYHVHLIEINDENNDNNHTSNPQPKLPENNVTTPVSPPPTFGKITEPDDPSKDSKQPLIDGNGGFESENKNNIKQSTRPQTGSCLFHRKSKLILIIIVVLSLITITSITIWIIFIKKTETTINGPKWDKWKQNAITMAGGNGQGQELNQLYGPQGIFIDKNKNIFIADTYNDRIVEWKHNANAAQVIAGGNGRGNRTDQLNKPTDVIFDQQNHAIITADQGNRRVIQWLNQKQQILIDSINCSRLAMDKYGFLYVSDWKKNEVRRWKMAEYNNEGIIVAGGNGKGNKLNQLNSPGFMFVDDDQSVYISDLNNHRVMKWKKDAKEGRIVIGGNGQGGNLTQLSYPEGIIIDHLRQIYVSDFGNNRVIRWCKGKEESEIVVGGNGQGNQSNQLIGPGGLAFDNEGNLYVVDHWNFRIQKFVTVL